MSISFVNASADVPGSTGSATPAEPSGVTQDDVLFYWSVYETSTFVSGPSGGWTLLNTWVGPNTVTKLYGIVRGVSAPGYTITITGGWIEADVVAFRGVDAATAFSNTAYNPPRQLNPNNPDTPSVTTTVPNSYVLSFGVGWSGGPFGAPSGYTGAWLSPFPPGGDTGIAYKVVASPGVENPGAFSGGAAALDDVAEATIVIAPPASTFVSPRSTVVRQAANRASRY